MANFKIVVSDPKSRKAYQKEVDQSTSGLLGKKIGSKVSGSFLGLQGYELEITGGSDKDGFPMRKDVEGAARKRVLLSAAPGFHPKIRGQRKRKSLRGNTISADISQVNTKVAKYGNQPIEKLLGGKEKKPEEKEAKPEEKAAEKPKEEKPAEEKPKEEAKPEEKPKEGAPEKAEKPAAPEKKPEEKMGVKEVEQQEKKEQPKEAKPKKEE